MALSLREFFFPSQFRPQRAEYASPKKPFKKKKEELDVPLLEPLPDLALYLPRRIAEQIQADIKRSLGFYYTGREQYRQQYLNAGIPPDQIPEEELEELPGAEGIRIPILGWATPSKQVRNIAKNWWESVVSWSDVSLALEQDFVWKPILRDWGIEGLQLDAKNQVLDATGNVLSITAAVKKEYPLTGAILDWTKYGGVRGDRRKRFGTVKEEWLKQIHNQITKDEPAMGHAALWRQVRDALAEKDDDKKKKLVTGLWRDFEGWFREGYTFGVSESYRNVFKIVEFRGLQFEAFDFLDLWENERLFRGYIWTGFLRPQTERKLSLYLQKHPKVYNLFYKAFSPILSPELTKGLLDSGQILPNRLIGAFVKRVFKEKGPGPKHYLTWKRWFLPGRFLEWAGRNLTKIQQPVVAWAEKQIIKGTLVGKALAPLAAGRAAFVQQALGKFKGLTKSGAVLAVRKQAARAALSLWRRGFKTLAKWLVRSVQGLTKFTGPVGAVVTTVGTFVFSKFLGKIWETSKKTVTVVILSSCACLSGLVMAPFILLVVVIGTAFQPGEMATGGVAEQLVQIVKTVTPSNIPADGNSHTVTYTIAVTNNSDEDASVTLRDEQYSQDFSSIVPAGATAQILGNFTASIPTQVGVDKIIVNTVIGEAVLASETVSLGASGILIIGNPSGQPPSGWPTDRGCVTQGPGGSFSHSKNGRIEAVDIGKLTGDGTDHKVYATHDGIAYAYTGPDGPFSAAAGKYVEVISHGGTFRTYYAHLSRHSVTSGTAVVKGTELGVMGKTGDTDGGAHVHYQFGTGGTYLGGPLKMESPYIPATVGSCSDACGCCFSGFGGVCGSGP